MKNLFLTLTLLLAQNLTASPGLGYTGRLVRSDGSPVTGTVDLSFELNYSADTSTILCEETITGVSLQNGVYSVSLNFDSGPGACDLAAVMQAIPGGQTLDIRVHDTTNSLTFNYQSIHSSPKAYVSDFALDVLDGTITPDKISTTGASNGDVLTFSGGAWTFGPGAANGLTSLGGLTGSTQGFATGTSGTAPAFNSSGTTHTLNIPMASTAGVTAGLISKTDYDNFLSGAGTSSINLTAGTGLTGGGALTTDRTFNVDVGVSTGKIVQVGAGNKVDTSLIPDLESLSNACSAGEKLISNGVGGFSCGTETVTAGTGLTGGGALTSDITVAVDTGTTTGKIPVIGAGDKLPSSIVDDTSKLPLNGGTMTGSIDVNGNNIFSISTIGLDGTSSGALSIAAPDTVSTYVLKLPANDGDPGQFLQTDGDGNTSWATVATSPTGLTSLGGLTGSAQGFATGTSGTAPAFNSSGSTHTLNIPMASTAGVTAGLISKTDYDNFTSGAASSVTLTAGTGLTGGGDLSADRTFNVDVGTTNGKIAQVGVGDKLDTSIIPNLEGLSNACSGGEKLISNGLGGFSCGTQTVTAGTGLTGGGALTSDITVAVDTGTTTGKIPVIGAGDKLPSSIIDDTSKLPLAGGTMSGNIDVDDNELLNVKSLEFKGATSGDVSIVAPDTVTTYVLKLPANDGDAGQFLQTDGDGNTSWATVSTGSSGTVTSVGAGTGLTGGPITGAGTLSIANGGVGTTQLANDAVTAAKLANNSVDTASIVNANVTTIKIADDAVTADKLADNAVSSSAIADGSITSAKIVDGTIANADISSGASISYSKLNIADGDLSIAKTSGLSSALSSKLSLAGGTMSGAIAMGSNKISGLPTPVANDEAATKAYVDAAAPDLEDIKTKTSGTYNRDNHSLEALRERIDNLESSVSTIQTNVGNLGTDISTVASGIASLQGSSGAFTWQVATSDSTLSAGNAYAVSGSSILDFTLPATCNAGDSLQLVAGGDKGYKLYANTGQNILYNGSLSGVIVMGFSTLTLTCVDDDTTWLVKQIDGNPTVTSTSGDSASEDIQWFGQSSGDLLDGQVSGINGVHDSFPYNSDAATCMMYNSEFYCLYRSQNFVGSYSAYKVSGITSPQQVVFGYEHVCILETTGEVKCFGRNNQRQLGNGDTNSSYTTTAVTPTGLNSGVNKIAASQYTTCVDQANEIKCWGACSNGRCGDNVTSSHYNAVPTTVHNMSVNDPSYLGYNGTTTPIDKLFSVSSYAMCAAKSGNIYCWGSNVLGASGVKYYPERTIIGATYDQILDNLYFYNKTNGELIQYTAGSSSSTTVDTGGDGFDIIGSAGRLEAFTNTSSYSSCLLFSDHKLRCIGRDYSGEMANGEGNTPHTTYQVVLTNVKKVLAMRYDDSFCALKLNKDLVCWGENSNNILGFGSDIGNLHSPLQVLSGIDDFGVLESNYSAYALSTDGKLYTWGYNNGTTHSIPMGFYSVNNTVQPRVAMTSPNTQALGFSGGLKQVGRYGICSESNGAVKCHVQPDQLSRNAMGSIYYPFFMDIVLSE